MDTIVTGCHDCPFRKYKHLEPMYSNTSQCYHPIMDSKLSDERSVTHYLSGKGSPDWCPLKIEPITITFKSE